MKWVPGALNLVIKRRKVEADHTSNRMALRHAQGPLNSSLRYKLQSTFTWMWENILTVEYFSGAPRILLQRYFGEATFLNSFFIQFISFLLFLLNSSFWSSEVRCKWDQHTKIQEENQRYCDRCNYSRTPLIRKLVIRIANYPDRLCPFW